jgi:hypothetical protein
MGAEFATLLREREREGERERERERDRPEWGPSSRLF